jgi:hypothetical protein
MDQPDLLLRVAILASKPTYAGVLKSIIESNHAVERVEIQKDREATEALFRNHSFNCMFIDIFSIGVPESIRFIEHMRRSYPIVPICLYSELANLVSMPDISEDWLERFEHYFKLPADQMPEELRQNAEEVLLEMVYYLQHGVALDRVGDLARFVQGQPGDIVISDEQKNELAEIVKAVEQALKNQGESRRSSVTSVIPGISTSQIEQMVNDTLKEARQSLQVTTRVNIGVLLAGSLLVLVSFVLASVTKQWEAVAFGGFGMAGIIASLITNPLRSISASANRIVQIQVAYFQFLSQLRLLSQDCETITILEKSQRLEDAMGKTVRILGEYGK